MGLTFEKEPVVIQEFYFKPPDTLFPGGRGCLGMRLASVCEAKQAWPNAALACTCAYKEV